MDQESKDFKDKFTHLYKLRLPSPWPQQHKVLGTQIYEIELTACRNNIGKI